ncbi:PQQ-binding-like beta-propeller repeat protein, partial [Streptomyces scabiei]|uniref:outer membrane protein assembly factor BamB family protein n=1 Tax=Streptomyces scabiei TaxID=1930 RepID=UPI0039EE9B81
KINAQVAIIVSAVVAIALIIGGGVWYAGSSDDGGKDDTASSSGGTGGDGGTDQKGGDGGKTSGAQEKAPADPASKVLFQVPMPAVSKEDSSVVVSGSWLTDKVYAKSGVAEVVGYDPDKGSKKWTIKLDGPVCATTRHVTDDNKTVIVHQPAMPTKAEPSHGCTQVAVLDLDAGKKVWTKTAGDEPISFDNVTISGDTVAAGSTDGGVAFDIAKGDILWSPKTTDPCYDAGYGGGEKLVAVLKCGSYDARQLNIQTIDPKSGKVLSEYKMAKGIEYAGVVSTEPLVVAADGNSTRLSLAMGLHRREDRPMGVAVRTYFTSPRHDDDYLESWLELWDRRGAQDRLLPGYGWVFGMGDGTSNVGLGVLNTSAAFKELDWREILKAWCASMPEDWGYTPDNMTG